MKNLKQPKPHWYSKVGEEIRAKRRKKTIVKIVAVVAVILLALITAQAVANYDKTSNNNRITPDSNTMVVGTSVTTDNTHAVGSACELRFVDCGVQN